MSTATLTPFAVTRGYQAPVDNVLSTPDGVATLPARVGGTDDLAIQTDGSTDTYHRIISGESDESGTLLRYVDVLSWDFRMDPALGVPSAVCLQITWKTDDAALASPPTGVRSWFTTASVVGTDTMIEDTSGGAFGDAIKTLENCTQATFITSRYFWAEVDDDNPTDSGNWLDSAFFDLSCLTADGMRFTVFMDTVNEAFPAYVNIAEARLVVAVAPPRYNLQIGTPVTGFQAGRSGWPNPPMFFTDADTCMVDGSDETYARITGYRQDSSWFTGTSNYVSAPVINASGDTFPGIDISLRMRASNDYEASTQGFYLDLHDADFDVEYDYSDTIPADGEWHDVVVTITASDLSDWGTDIDAFWAAMVAGNIVLDLNESGGTSVASSYTRTLDYAQVGPIVAVEPIILPPLLIPNLSASLGDVGNRFQIPRSLS